MASADSGTFLLGGDLPVHRLGFGAMRITGAGTWGPPPDRQGTLRLLRRVVGAGVDFIDTADSYGPNVSEELIAEALHPYPAGLVIATKGGLIRPGPGVWRSDARPVHLREVCEGSLRRLRVQRIDLYQLHAPDPKVPLEDSLATLVELQREGKIRHIGVSNFDVEELERGVKVATIVSVQNRYNLADRSSADVLAWCEARGIGFIPWRPLAYEGLERKVEAIAQRHGATSQQIALAWLLQRSPVMLPIPGTSSLKHFETNLGATHLKLTNEEMQSLEE